MDKFLENISLADFTTYRIGGPAKYFFIAKTKEELVEALKAAKEVRLPTFILGGGSNVLFSDKGFNGLVIKIQLTGYKVEENKIYTNAGTVLMEVAYAACDKGFTGLEWAAGLPGTAGGAIFGHAQAFGARISDSVKSVEALNLKTLETKNFTREECQFTLKNSIFKKTGKWVIISAVLELKSGNTEEINTKVKEFLEYRKTKHPIDFPSAGSTFVNPEVKIKNKAILIKYPELKDYNEKGTIPAGYLIAKCGLSGKQIGGAQISEKHCNFIINTGGATAKDVLALIKLVRQKVKTIFKIDLEPEVRIIAY